MTYLIVTSLILLSALFSGLTLGLFSLNKTALERKIKLGNEEAKKVYTVRKNGNLLLCTLLIGNSAVNSAIAIFLGSIAGGVVAGIMATSLIVIFGEILPQAVFSRKALLLGAKSAWLVKVFIFVFYPISAPLAWLLDKMLGEELSTVWSKKEIKEIVKYHEDHPDSIIDEDEERIMLGALSYSEKTAGDVMTPKPVVYLLNGQSTLTKELIFEIRDKGYSRIPVYDKHSDTIVGVLFAKDLLGLDLSKKTIKIADVQEKKTPLKVKELTKLDDLLDLMVKKKRHITVVYDQYNSFIGIVSLEDVLEEILRTEIMDEKDTVLDMQDFARKLARNHRLN
jgi:metal transporter CNNM